MPRQPIDLSAHRQTIIWWITQEKWPISRVLDVLEKEHNLPLSENTLKRNMNAWGISIRPRIKVTAEMRQRIYDLFYQERYYTDSQMAKILKRDGFTISHRKLSKVRKSMGLSKRKDTIIPANPVVPGEVIEVEDNSASSDEDDDDDEDGDYDGAEDNENMEVDPVIALENTTRPQTTSQSTPPQPHTQPREPAWRKKRPSNPTQPVVHQAPRISTTFTDSRHSPPPPTRVPSPPPSPPPASTEIYSEPPANGKGLARRVTTLTTRIEAVETDNAALKQTVDQQRTENADLRQLIHQQRTEMDMMRASLNELITRFNNAHY